MLLFTAAAQAWLLFAVHLDDARALAVETVHDGLLLDYGTLAFAQTRKAVAGLTFAVLIMAAFLDLAWITACKQAQHGVRSIASRFVLHACAMLLPLALGTDAVFFFGASVFLPDVLRDLPAASVALLASRNWTYVVSNASAFGVPVRGDCSTGVCMLAVQPTLSLSEHYYKAIGGLEGAAFIVLGGAYGGIIVAQAYMLHSTSRPQ